MRWRAPTSAPDVALQRGDAPRRRLRERLLLAALPPLIAAALRLLYATLRVRIEAAELLRRMDAGEQVIIAFWHGRLLMMPAAALGRRVCVINSRSRDGEIATRVLRFWGIESVRGSASRGGAAGFLGLVRAYRRGFHLAVVPDGPRGPRERAKAGVVHLARATGARIFPVSFAASRAWRLRSWDAMIVPRPFARVVVVAGSPLKVPRKLDEAEVEHWRAEIDRRLEETDHEARRRLAA